MFNVDCIQPYFPPLLDTSDIAEQLTPKILSVDWMEHATIDCVMDMEINSTCQQKIQIYQVVKVGQPLHQGKWFTKDQVQKFPHLMEEINVMGTLAS